MQKSMIAAMALAGVSAMATYEGGPTYTMKYEMINNVKAYKVEVKGLKEGGHFAFSEGKPSAKPVVNTIKFTGTDQGDKQITDWSFKEGAIIFTKDGTENLESKTATKEADGTWTMSAYRKFETGDGQDGDNISCGYVGTWRWTALQTTDNIDSSAVKEGNISVQFSVSDCAMTIQDIKILA